jgi:hypothetical protein
MQKNYFTTKTIVYLLILQFFNAADLRSQTIINGDFEIHQATACEINLVNSTYANFMSYSWGFGTADELDIQNFSCGYAIPPSNNWFVSLSKKEFLNDGDALSLKIDTNLIMGNTYEISYYEFASDTNFNANIPIEIGLSADSLNFGDLIFTSMPLFNVWTLKTFSFVAPNNGNFITIRIDTAGTESGWNFIDNIHFSVEVGSSKLQVESTDFVLFPNPNSGHINLSLPINTQNVMLFTAEGQLIKNIDAVGLSKMEFLMESKGIYFVQLVTNSGNIVKKLVVY